MKNKSFLLIFSVLFLTNSSFCQTNATANQNSELTLEEYAKSINKKREVRVYVRFAQKGKSTKRGRLPKVVIHKDVYKDSVLYIKAGTPVEIESTYKKRKESSRGELSITLLSTTSVSGIEIPLNMTLDFYGKEDVNVYKSGLYTMAFSGLILFPIYVPMIVCSVTNAVVKKGTVFTLDITT